MTFETLIFSNLIFNGRLFKIGSGDGFSSLYIEYTALNNSKFSSIKSDFTKKALIPLFSHPTRAYPFFFANFTSHENRYRRRHYGKTKYHCGKQSHYHGRCHGVEHFTFDASEREQGDINNGNDQYTKQTGTYDFISGFIYNIQSF